MNKKLLTIPALILAAAVAVGSSTKASAEGFNLNTQLGIGVHNNTAHVQVRAENNGDDNDNANGDTNMMYRMPGVFGTVTTISGDTITVQSKMWAKPATGSTAPTSTTITYTVNATGATVTKNQAASSVSAIAVGDTVMVQGTVSGTSVTATKINDGVMMPQDARGVFGTVTAVNGSTLTVQSKGFGKDNSTTTTTT